MSDQNGNGELRKLVEARRKFLDNFHAATTEYEEKLDQLRDEYLETITYSALNDPYLVEVRRALHAKAEKAVAESPAPVPASATETCPGCGEEIVDENASFCSNCAFPLNEGRMNEESNVVSAGRRFRSGQR